MKRPPQRKVRAQHGEGVGVSRPSPDVPEPTGQTVRDFLGAPVPPDAGEAQSLGPGAETVAGGPGVTEFDDLFILVRNDD